MSEVRTRQFHLPFERVMQTMLRRALCRQLQRKSACQVYLHQTKADIVFPIETKTQISTNLLHNFTTISCMGESSGGVAILLKNHIPYSRHNRLEDSSVDNVVLTVRLGGFRLVMATAYVRPDDFENSEKQ